MADTPIIYGAGGEIYVGPGGKAPEPEVVEEKKEEPKVEVKIIEDDTPLTDEQVIEKVSGTSE